MLTKRRITWAQVHWLPIQGKNWASSSSSGTQIAVGSIQLFNQLPEIIKDNKDYIYFIKQVKTLLNNNAKERLSSYAWLYCIYI
jgi:hypothetical protein